MEAIDLIKNQTTSEAEILYKWQDKLSKDNYFATDILLINYSSILKPTLSISKSMLCLLQMSF